MGRFLRDRGPRRCVHAKRRDTGTLQEGERVRRLESDGQGRWRIDGSWDGNLDGCLDVDLESSACTNVIPIRRLSLQVGETASAPAAFVHAQDLSVTRLDQSYARLAE